MKLREDTTQAIREAAAEKGCRMLAVESAGAGRFSVVRVILERAGGEPVTLEDCEVVSRRVSALLDASDEIPHRYTLEVSSPGLDRKLYDLEDVRRFVGRRVKVQTETPVEAGPLDPSVRSNASPARRFSGILRAVEGDLLTIVDEENRKIYNVRFGDIRVARLDFLWPERAN
jgi:ribosome maturation factor RimP